MEKAESQLRGSRLCGGTRPVAWPWNAGLRWPFTRCRRYGCEVPRNGLRRSWRSPRPCCIKPARLRPPQGPASAEPSARTLDSPASPSKPPGSFQRSPRSSDGGTAGLPGEGRRLPTTRRSRFPAPGSPPETRACSCCPENPSLVDSLDLACGDCFQISGAATIEAAARQLAEDGADGLFVDLDEFRARRMSDLLGLLR